MSRSGTAYKLLGFAVWRGGKWYVQRTYLSRLPSRRTSVAAGLTTLVAGVGAVALARRALS